MLFTCKSRVFYQHARVGPVCTLLCDLDNIRNVNDSIRFYYFSPRGRLPQRFKTHKNVAVPSAIIIIRNKHNRA